mmetsp:Transcript_9356/g.18726  ORF Transcript_9356/g.18726 Transcript_9356/m.18726 type:complete len:247 (+) Transcript_9356:700-1440(+)
MPLFVEDGDRGNSEDHDVEDQNQHCERGRLLPARLACLELDQTVEQRDRLHCERGGLHVVDEHIRVGLNVYKVQKQDHCDGQPRGQLVERRVHQKAHHACHHKLACHLDELVVPVVHLVAFEEEPKLLDGLHLARVLHIPRCQRVIEVAPSAKLPSYPQQPRQPLLACRCRVQRARLDEARRVELVNLRPGLHRLLLLLFQVHRVDPVPERNHALCTAGPCKPSRRRTGSHSRDLRGLILALSVFR